MSLLSNLQLMSQYNQWMNQKLYQTAGELGDAEIKQNRGAFFGSILGTLNHIYVADIIWLRRFASHSIKYPSLEQLPELPSYRDLRQTVASNINDLTKLRQELDELIITWCQELKPEDLASNLQYTDTKGKAYKKNLGQLIHNLFNHQTHHRGQATTLISQQGLDVGVTDWLAILPEQSD